MRQEVLGAKPTDAVGLALLRAALRVESGGLIIDIDSSIIYIRRLCGKEEIVRLAMQAFKRILPDEEFERLKFIH